MSHPKNRSTFRDHPRGTSSRNQSIQSSANGVRSIARSMECSVHQTLHHAQQHTPQRSVPSLPENFYAVWDRRDGPALRSRNSSSRVPNRRRVLISPKRRNGRRSLQSSWGRRGREFPIQPPARRRTDDENVLCGNPVHQRHLIGQPGSRSRSLSQRQVSIPAAPSSCDTPAPGPHRLGLSWRSLAVFHSAGCGCRRRPCPAPRQDRSAPWSNCYAQESCARCFAFDPRMNEAGSELVPRGKPIHHAWARQAASWSNCISEPPHRVRRPRREGP